MKNRPYLSLIASLAWLVCALIVPPALAKDCEAALNEREALPPNLILSKDARRALEKVWKRSLTFRDQCRRIARAPWMKIRVRFVARRAERYGALTTLKKYECGYTVSTIQIFITSEYVERLGHEFEHLVEQIEGLNLRKLAEEEGSGVRQTRPGYYETERAVKAGRRVYDEYRRAKTVCKEGVQMDNTPGCPTPFW